MLVAEGRVSADDPFSGLLRMQVGYFAKLQRLVEEAVADRGEPCIIIAHSMGGLVGHYFLTKVPCLVAVAIQSAAGLS